MHSSLAPTTVILATVNPAVADGIVVSIAQTPRGYAVVAFDVDLEVEDCVNGPIGPVHILESEDRAMDFAFAQLIELTD